jgi:hypothetical protein
VELTEDAATGLCERVIEELVAWRVLPAILQVGGIESRGSSRILQAIESWLEEQGRTDLLVLPEYRLSKGPSPDETTDSAVVQAADKLLRGKRIDYALVRSESVGKSRLKVDTVIEVKTNYLCQPELRKRPVAACDQAREYGEISGTNHTYVLYVVVSAVGAAPAEPRDAGWGYYRQQHPSVADSGPIDIREVQVLGQYPAGGVGRLVKHQNMSAQIWAYVLQRR